MTNRSDSFQRILGVDALRGVLCLYVIAYHLVCHYSGLSPLFNSLFSNGIFPVQVFFCVSGFLIYHSFSKRSKVEPNPIASFYLRRALRILPLWWLLVLVLFFCGKITEIKILFLNLTFLFGFFSYNAAFIPVAVSWSLFVEEIFYLFYPWFYKFHSMKRNLLLVFFFLSLSLLLKYIPSLINFPTGNSFIEHSPLIHFHYFFLGILIYHLQERNWSLTFLNVLTLILFLGSIFSHFIPNIIAVFLVTLISLRPNTILFKLIDFKILKWIGVRCYCIYLIHSELGMALDLPTAKFLSIMTNIPDIKMIVHFVILSIETFLVAGLSYKYFERPFIKAHP